MDSVSVCVCARVRVYMRAQVGGADFCPALLRGHQLHRKDVDGGESPLLPLCSDCECGL